jgi:hypothetical protein
MRGYSKGLAALETSMLVAVVFSLGMGAVAVLSYIGEVSAINRVVDELVVADAVKPLRLRMNQGTVVHEVNQDGLTAYLAATLTKLQQQIGTATPYRIELQYQVVNIDQDSGGFTGFNAASAAVNAGTSSSAVAGCPPIGSMLISEAARTIANGPSALAVRIGVGRYLPMSVMVGVRVLRDLSGTGTGVLYQSVTQQPLVAFSCKTFFLRSGVEG